MNKESAFEMLVTMADSGQSDLYVILPYLETHFGISESTGRSWVDEFIESQD